MTIYLSAVLKYNLEVFVLYLSTCYFILLSTTFICWQVILQIQIIQILRAVNSDQSDIVGTKKHIFKKVNFLCNLARSYRNQ